MSNQDKMHIQLNIFKEHFKKELVTDRPTDWDGEKYNFCWQCRDEDVIVNGFYPEYCITSWGRDNTVMLMKLFQDYNYNITTITE